MLFDLSDDFVHKYVFDFFSSLIRYWDFSGSGHTSNEPHSSKKALCPGILDLKILKSLITTIADECFSHCDSNCTTYKATSVS